MVTVTRTIEPYVNFVGGDGKSYGIVDTSYDVTVGITDDVSTLVMDVTCNKLRIVPAEVPGFVGGGYNTLFISALRKPRAATPFTDRIGNEQSGFHTNWQGALEDASMATYGVNWSVAQNNFITAAGIKGSSVGDTATSGIIQGQTRRLTMPLTSADFDSQGNFIGSPLFVQSSLWWNTTDVLTGTKDVDGETINSRDYVCGVEVYGFTFESLDYYPGMISSSSQWYSCNRSGGGAFIKEAGAWRGVKNSLYPIPTAYVNKGLIRSGSAWRVQDLIGIGKEG